MPTGPPLPDADAGRSGDWARRSVRQALCGTAKASIGCSMPRTRDRERIAFSGCSQEAGWDVATEVSFNVRGERGSIDILAFHQATGSLLVIEIKSVVPDLSGDAR